MAATKKQLYHEHEAGATYAHLAEKYGYTETGVRGMVSKYRRTLATHTAQQPPAWLLLAALQNTSPQPDDVTPPVTDDTDVWLDVLARLRALSRHARVLVVGDEHMDDHDPRALNLHHQIAAWFAPDLIILNGDTFDFASLSVFVKSRRDGKGDAFKIVRPHYQRYIRGYRMSCPTTPILLNGGNHNDRLDRAADEFWALGETIEEQYAELVRQGGDVIWLNWKQEVNVGPLFIEHGTRYGENAAKNSLKDLGWAQAKVQNHAHTPGKYTIRQKVRGQNRYVIVQSVVNGCSCNIPPRYKASKTDQSKWIQGCALYSLNMQGDEAHVTDVVYHEYADGALVAVVGKKVFTARDGGVMEATDGAS